MKFITPLALVLIIAFIFSLFSCTYKEVEIVKMENVYVKKISAQGISIEVLVKVKNPNNYRISIIDSDLDIFVNDKSFGKAKLSEKIVFSGKSEQVHKFLIESNFQKSGSSILTAITSVLLSRSVQLQVKGSIKAKAFFIPKKINVDFSRRVNI